LLSELGHFAASTLLHIINWPKELVNYIRKIDHVMIFPKIMGTYYAITSTIIPDIDPMVLKTVEFGSILGIISRILFTDAPGWIITLPYYITGWAILLNPKAIISVYKRLPFGVLICLLGGILYSIGGYIYIKKYPNLWPGYLEYHELFHIFTILGTFSFTHFVFNYAIPYYLQNRSITHSSIIR
jgi:hemolysin III